MGYWDNLSSQRTFMDNLAKKLGIVDMEGWYSITAKTLQMNGGSTLARKYNGSVFKMLAILYPEYKQACRDFVMNIVKELKLSKVEDVIQVPLEYQSSPLVRLSFVISSHAAHFYFDNTIIPSPNVRNDHS